MNLALIPALLLAAASPPTDARISQVQAILRETQIEAKDLPKDAALARVLADLQARLPHEKKITLRIDRDAFGKDFDQIANSRIFFHPFPKKRMLASCLLTVRAQASKVVKVDFAVRSEGVVITRPELAAHWAKYDLSDFGERLPFLLHELTSGQQRPTKLADGPALLARRLATFISVQPWEKLEVENGARLSAYLSPHRHYEVETFLASLRRLADLGVFMNARLYEVDRAFFMKHVAPLFAANEDSEDQPAVIAIGKETLKWITGQTLILESVERKILPGQQATFLAKQSIFRFNGGPLPLTRKRPLEPSQPTEPSEKSENGHIVKTGLSGVTFSAHSLVSPDRFYLRLEITQISRQLVGIDKTSKLEPTTGKTIEVESPNVRETIRKGTVQISDLEAILMPVAYQPEQKDKLWLMVARPMIWIEEEAKLIREEGKKITPRSAWNEEIPAAELLPPPLRLTPKTREILQAVISDVLTNPDLKGTRDFYGTPRDKIIAFTDGKFSWPANYYPATHGWLVVRPDPFDHPRRVLGIRLDAFELKPDVKTDIGGPIDVVLHNAGGSANGGVIGACHVYYEPRRVGRRWTVKLVGMFDP